MTDPEREKFFSRMRERFLSVAKKRIVGASCEDVVQEAMMILMRKIDEVRGEKHLLPFAFQILRNCLGNYYQKTRRERQVIDFNADVSTATRDEPTRNDEWAELVSRAMQHLERDHAKCAGLIRAVLRSAPVSELKQLLNTDEANVYRTLYRCRMRLKTILTDVMQVRLP